MSVQFSTDSVLNLQKFLQERGVVFSGARKLALVELCLLANSLGLELDPGGLKEDRTEVVSAKLTRNNY